MSRDGFIVVLVGPGGRGEHDGQAGQRTHYVASAPRRAQAVRRIARAVCGADGQLRVVIRRVHVLTRPAHVRFPTTLA